MRRPGSRYQDTVRFDCGPEPGLLRARAISAATGVLEHTIEAGERLDLLARRYYNDDRSWWRILDANPSILFGTDLSLTGMAGQRLRIPRAKE